MSLIEERATFEVGWWNRSDLEGITEFKQLMDVVHKYEVLAYMSQKMVLSTLPK